LKGSGCRSFLALPMDRFHEPRYLKAADTKAIMSSARKYPRS
jgi:hypothetical protein